jgi:hypothetical protein
VSRPAATVTALPMPTLLEDLHRAGRGRPLYGPLANATMIRMGLEGSRLYGDDLTEASPSARQPQDTN